jgi:A/G-specific adenine glycosylase
VTSFAKDLLAWFQEHGRKGLPWQSSPPDIYHVWLSEVMLQQTQVTTVVDYFNKFVVSFPTVVALANADEEEVLASWAGLGYYSRARNLHKSAKIILSEYRGNFPTSYSELISLPGIGESTAGAILSLACNQSRPILDGNVKRVLSRFHRVAGDYSDSNVLKEFWRLAKYHTPAKQNANYAQAIMDLGATICLPRKPLCPSCPVSSHCKANLCNDQASFPQKKPRTIRPEKSLAFLAYHNDKGAIYLVKRPNKGVWGGLWSFEECEDTEAAITAAIKEHNLEASIVSSLPKFKHSFTHYHLWIHPIIINSPGLEKDYYNINKLALGVPTPVKKIISMLDSLNSAESNE